MEGRVVFSVPFPSGNCFCDLFIRRSLGLRIDFVLSLFVLCIGSGTNQVHAISILPDLRVRLCFCCIIRGHFSYVIHNLHKTYSTRNQESESSERLQIGIYSRSIPTTEQANTNPSGLKLCRNFISLFRFRNQCHFKLSRPFGLRLDRLRLDRFTIYVKTK